MKGSEWEYPELHRANAEWVLTEHGLGALIHWLETGHLVVGVYAHPSMEGIPA